MERLCRQCGDELLKITQPNAPMDWVHKNAMTRINFHLPGPVTPGDIAVVAKAIKDADNRNDITKAAGFEAAEAAINAYLKGLSHK